MRSTKGMNRPTGFALLLAAAVMLEADPGAAQTASPWTAWFGCWEAVAPTVETGIAAPVAPATGTLCVLPGVGSGVAEFVTIDEGNEQRVRLSADGQRISLERDGCSGWESVSASPDGKRIYRFSEFDCGGQLPRRTSSILGFVGSGEWVDVEGVSVGDFTDIRVARYRRATATPEAASALDGRALQIDAARTVASARIGLSDVIEASRQVDAAVVEGWLIERNQGFALNADRLRELAKAEVPDRVIDLMVALSYPTVFAIDRTAREGEFVREEATVLASDMPRPLSPTIINRWYDPYYGYGYGYGYGYDPFYSYGRYSRYGSWYGPPVIIVREPVAEGGEQRPSQGSAPRLVNGRGFSRGGSPAASNPGSSNSGSSNSGSSASSGASGSSQSGASAPTRTAKPRTP